MLHTGNCSFAVVAWTILFMHYTANILGIWSLTSVLQPVRGLALVFLWVEGSERGLEQNLPKSPVGLGLALAPAVSAGGENTGERFLVSAALDSQSLPLNE